jgi:hypothetical protein
MSDIKKIKENRLKQYGILMPYLQYENSTFWVRNSFFLLANTVLFGIVFSIISTSISKKTLNREAMFISLFVSVIGLFLSILWIFAIRKGEYWINRWSKILKEIEPEAFDSLEVLRKAENDTGKDYLGVRRIAQFVSYLFLGSWMVSIFYCIIKVCKSQPMPSLLELVLNYFFTHFAELIKVIFN